MKVELAVSLVKREEKNVFYEERGVRTGAQMEVTTRELLNKGEKSRRKAERGKVGKMRPAHILLLNSHHALQSSL